MSPMPSLRRACLRSGEWEHSFADGYVIQVSNRLRLGTIVTNAGYEEGHGAADSFCSSLTYLSIQSSAGNSRNTAYIEWMNSHCDDTVWVLGHSSTEAMPCVFVPRTKLFLHTSISWSWVSPKEILMNISPSYCVKTLLALGYNNGMTKPVLL